MNLSLSQQTQEDSNKVPQITSVTSSQNAPVKQQLSTETMEVIASNYVPDSILVKEHDAIVAELLAHKHGDSLIFDADKKQWRVFSNGIWCGPEEAGRLIWKYYNRLILDIYEHKYPDLPIGGEDWLTSSMNRGKRSAVMKDVETITARGADDLDTKQDLIGIQDMVYDIQHKGIRPALASDLIFKSLGTTYDPGARCPKWEGFLNTVMQEDPEMISYLQRLVGYFLTASTQEQEIYYFYGSGANGKSTFLDLIKTLLGSYGVKLSSDTFMRGKNGATSLGKQSSLANLEGARLAITDETNDTDVSFDVQILKSISGDDEITARRLRHNPRTFKSTSKIVMYGNDKPHGNINDEGFWRRFRFIKFGYVVPDDERIDGLLDQLKGELPGILNWALRGLEDWHKEGLKTPGKIIDESVDYREELDTVSEFFTNNVVPASGNAVHLVKLFEGYVAWCSNNMKVAETKQAFSKRVKQYFEANKMATPYKTNKVRGYKGVKLV
jgi:putative DNA primase/helicase